MSAFALLIDEIRIQRATSNFISAVSRGMGGRPYQDNKKDEEEFLTMKTPDLSNENSTHFDYSLLEVALMLAYNPIRKSFYLLDPRFFNSLLSSALFGELMINNIVDLLPVQPGMVLKYDATVSLANPSSNNHLINEAISIIKRKKNVNSVWLCRILSGYWFQKGIKKFSQTVLSEAKARGLVQESTSRGFFYNSTNYSVNEEARAKVANLIKAVALENYTPKTVKELAIVALYYSFLPLGAFHFQNVVADDIIPKDQMAQATKNLDNFFLQYSI